MKGRSLANGVNVCPISNFRHFPSQLKAVPITLGKVDQVLTIIDLTRPSIFQDLSERTRVVLGDLLNVDYSKDLLFTSRWIGPNTWPDVLWRKFLWVRFLLHITVFSISKRGLMFNIHDVQKNGLIRIPQEVSILFESIFSGCQAFGYRFFQQ